MRPGGAAFQLGLVGGAQPGEKMCPRALVTPPMPLSAEGRCGVTKSCRVRSFSTKNREKTRSEKEKREPSSCYLDLRLGRVRTRIAQRCVTEHAHEFLLSRYVFILL